MTTITLTDRARAHCTATPRTDAEAALLALDGTTHADDADARCAIEAALGRAAARARDACAAWIGQHPARPDEHFAAEIFERAGRLAAWAVRRDAPPLTPNQRFVLEAVAASRASRGRDPTQREVAEALGVTPARVSQLMRRLRERGDLDGPAPPEDR